MVIVVFAIEADGRVAQLRSVHHAVFGRFAVVRSGGVGVDYGDYRSFGASEVAVPVRGDVPVE